MAREPSLMLAAVERGNALPLAVTPPYHKTHDRQRKIETFVQFISSRENKMKTTHKRGVTVASSFTFTRGSQRKNFSLFCIFVPKRSFAIHKTDLPYRTCVNASSNWDTMIDLWPTNIYHAPLNQHSLASSTYCCYLQSG